MAYQATIQVRSKGDYIVQTDLPPHLLSELAVMIFQAWLQFALGQDTIGGYSLLYPTGRYARSIRFEQRKQGTVIAIFADSSVAPEANILETGHKSWDMKATEHYREGSVHPMHRGGGYSPAAKSAVWAESRGSGFTGYARVGGHGWIMPEMPAYAPAKLLADLAALAARNAK